MVAHFNELRKLPKCSSYRHLFLFKQIIYGKCNPHNAHTSKEQAHQAGTPCIKGCIKHNVWPIAVPSMHRSTA